MLDRRSIASRCFNTKKSINSKNDEEFNNTSCSYCTTYTDLISLAYKINLSIKTKNFKQNILLIKGIMEGLNNDIEISQDCTKKLINMPLLLNPLSHVLIFSN